MLVDLCSCSSDWYGLGFAVILLDFLGGSDGEASAYNVRNLGSIPGLGRSPGKGTATKNEDHGIQSHHFMANRCGNNGNSERLYFLGLQNHCRR